MTSPAPARRLPQPPARHRARARFARALSCLLALLPILSFCGCGGTPDTDESSVLHLPLRTQGLGSLDPVRGLSSFENRACSMVYETLLQYRYPARETLELEPLLLTTLPERSEDGRVWSFELRRGVRFTDDECFPDGRGRELVSADVVYSWKRMADEDNRPLGWWMFADTIVDFDEYRTQQNAAESFDYDAPVEGLRIVDDHRFEVRLKEPVYRFIGLLAMFQLAVVPREAVEHYGTRFGRQPVGTGPYRLAEWTESGIAFERNPSFREELFPAEVPGDELTAGFAKYAGRRLPLVDRVRFTFFDQSQPMWLRFESGDLAFTQVPSTYFATAFDPTSRELLPEYAAQGYEAHKVPVLEFIFRMFNLEDPVVGGYDDRARALRKAIVLAIDWDEFNETFYGGKSIVFDGMLPPGMDGAPTGEDRRVRPDFRGRNVARARELMIEAGYPGGEGLEPIEYFSPSEGDGPEQAEMLARQLADVGVRLDVRVMPFKSMLERINNKGAAFFTFGWSADYPDAENHLAVFYGPNEAPGNNRSNYRNAAYDELYEEMRLMTPGPERTAIIERMRDLVLEDAVFAGSLARLRFYLAQPWLENFRPNDTYHNWIKYLGVNDELR